MDENVMSCNDSSIGLVVDYRLNSNDVERRLKCGLMMSIACIGNRSFKQSKKQIILYPELQNFILEKRKLFKNIIIVSVFFKGVNPKINFHAQPM